MDAMCLESLESLNQTLARAIEVLEDGLQAFRCNGFYSHQRASDVRLPHGIEKLRIFGCLHRDLGVENHLGGEFGQARHQLESVFTNRPKLIQLLLIVLPFGQSQIGQCDRVKIVVGQSDEAEPLATQFHDFSDNAVRSPLPWTLTIGAPHRAKRAVFWAASNGLNRSPHVAVSWKQIPTRWRETIGFDPSALIH